MRERVNELKGGLEIEAADPGLRLRAIVPLVAALHRPALGSPGTVKFPLVGATDMTLSHALRM